MPEKGKVKWFSNVKGYGFLERDGQPDVFVHYKAVAGEGYQRLKPAEEVTFDIAEGKKGPTAANVVRNKKPAEKKEGEASKK